MKPAVQVYARRFDTDFFALPADLQQRIEAKIDNLGTRLDSFPHERLQGTPAFRLRVGDYRVIYTFDLANGVLNLVAIGHRREVYRRAG